MRMTFDNGDRDSLIASWSRKKVGRKHNHQPRGRARDKRLAALERSAAQRDIDRRKYNAAVRAFWLGIADEHPA